MKDIFSIIMLKLLVLKAATRELSPDTQFKIVDRVMGRREEIIDENNSLVNLIQILKEEVNQARKESKKSRKIAHI
jgi:hypothetical protein